ncbi:hypothetical protein [Chryseobacterium sp. 2R14A]|uniref:hypothetical protein n=1 Tax=Chryseobacterium sp. 2R14A TaxID=3380353 RepID=UPI003CF90208
MQTITGKNSKHLLLKKVYELAYKHGYLDARNNKGYKKRHVEENSKFKRGKKAVTSENYDYNRYYKNIAYYN